MSELHPASVGPQPDHSGDPAPVGGPPPEPKVSAHEALVAMHGLFGEALGVMAHLAALVPTASGAGAQLMNLRERLAKVLDPPKT